MGEFEEKLLEIENKLPVKTYLNTTLPSTSKKTKTKKPVLDEMKAIDEISNKLMANLTTVLANEQRTTNKKLHRLKNNLTEAIESWQQDGNLRICFST